METIEEEFLKVKANMTPEQARAVELAKFWCDVVAVATVDIHHTIDAVTYCKKTLIINDDEITVLASGPFIDTEANHATLNVKLSCDRFVCDLILGLIPTHIDDLVADEGKSINLGGTILKANPYDVDIFMDISDKEEDSEDEIVESLSNISLFNLKTLGSC